MNKLVKVISEILHKSNCIKYIFVHMFFLKELNLHHSTLSAVNYRIQ